jgi:hypothetical protein
VWERLPPGNRHSEEGAERPQPWLTS